MFALMCKNKEGYNIDIELIQEQNNCYIYGSLKEDGITKGSNIFGKWFRYMFELKEKYPECKVLIKLITSSLWGRLAEFNRLFKTDEQIVEENENIYREKYGDNVPIEFHPIIRSEKACYDATKRAIDIANKHKARLHILHLTTEAETHLFRNDIPLQQKNITTEVSVHHLWFSDIDYKRLGTLIKWNPAIKTEKDKKGLLKALLDDRIDIITTDHAPHTLDEKQKPYFQSISGAPIVQHSLNIMLEFYKQGLISLEKIAEKMCHNPTIIYRIEKRGFIREGYFADLTIVDLNSSRTVAKNNILSKFAWSPL
jgi:dihydroorotase